MTDKTDIAALREAAYQVTPGGWCTDSQYSVIADAGLNGNYYVSACSGPHCRANAKFIALANPATIIALLDQLEAERQRADKAEAWVKTAERTMDYQAGVITQLGCRAEVAEKERDDALKTSWPGTLGELVKRCTKLEVENAVLVSRTAELREKLAKPVVLSDCSFEAVSHMAHWYSEGECVAWVSGAEHVKKQVLAAGFQVREE